MKNIIVLVLLFFIGCKQAEIKPTIVEKPLETIRIDTIFIPKIDTIFIVEQDVSIIQLQKSNDSLKTANNKLGKKLLHSELVITNARYYLNIVNKNPSQQKFLRGWMNRALNQ